MHNTGPIQWAGGEHDFALNLGQLRALQDKCDAGPEEILTRLRNGRWLVDDIVETIRLGLIGSGAKTQAEAGKFVTGLFDTHAPAAMKITAVVILYAALLGIKDDPVGEAEGERSDPPENGASASSTEAAQ